MTITVFDTVVVTAHILAWFATYEVSASTCSEHNFKDRCSKGPPGWVFALVWSTLYTLLGISGGQYIIQVGWTTDDTLTIAILVLYYSNLFLNKLWTRVFFMSFKAAMGVLFLLFGTAVSLLVGFIIQYDDDTITTLVPVITSGCYTAWLLYAGYLNYKCMSDETQVEYKATDARLEEADTSEAAYEVLAPAKTDRFSIDFTTASEQGVRYRG